MRHRPALLAATITLALGTGSLVTPAGALATTSLASKAPASSAPAIAKSANYPFAAYSPSRVDPWGAGIRQCTSFASWWLTQHGVAISRTTTIHGPHGGAQLENAAHWEVAARSAGFTVSRKPVVGAIAQWRANERSTWPIPGGYTFIQAGPTGHVAVVRKVYPDGSALIEDYNGAVPLGMHTFRGKAPRYLLIHA